MGERRGRVYAVRQGSRSPKASPENPSGLVMSRGVGIQSVEFLAWLEADGFARRNAHFRAGPWVAADSGLARANAENAETTQFDAVAGGKSLLEAFENGVHGGFRFGAGQPGPLNDVMDNILFDQSVFLILRRNLGAEDAAFGPAASEDKQRPTGAMLLRLGAVVNLRPLQYDKQLRALLQDLRPKFTGRACSALF